MRFISIVYMFLIFSGSKLSCKTIHTKNSMTYPTFFVIAHRGSRGAMPENSIPAMKKAIDQGANTIEFDVHISKDKQVVVYHDASLNLEYTTAANGEEISKEKRKDYI